MMNEPGGFSPYTPPSDSGSPQDDSARQIGKWATTSVVVGVLGLFCCGVIFGPLAISYANRAEAFMITSETGQGHAGAIKLGRALGYADVIVWAVLLVLRFGALLVRM